MVQFPFTDYETFVITDPEFGQTIKSNLPRDAFISVAFSGTGTGSLCHVFSDNNFSSNDQKVYHAQWHQGISTPIPIADNFCNTASAGANVKLDGGNFAAGRVTVTVRICYF